MSDNTSSMSAPERYQAYMELMVELMKDEEKKKKFEECGPEAREMLRNVGMIVPEHAIIRLDKDQRRWAGAHIWTGTEEIDFTESALSVTVNVDSSSEHIEKDVKLDKPGEVDFTIPKNFDECGVMVILPYFDKNTDIITDINFSDDKEILLTGC